jgi:Fur family zinc uptake transcriptional regulator
MLYHNFIGALLEPALSANVGALTLPTLIMPSPTQPSPPISVSDQLNVAESLCQERGRRLTPIRRKVLELLLSHGRSLKAYELLESMRAVHPGAAPPTVYRALDFLMEEGLIHRLDAVNAWSACHDAGGAPHDLLVVCTSCGAVAELSDPAMSKLLADRVARTGFALASHETEIRALCAVCQKDPAKQAEHRHDHGHSH